MLDDIDPDQDHDLDHIADVATVAVDLEVEIIVVEAEVVNIVEVVEIADIDEEVLLRVDPDPSLSLIPDLVQ